MSRIRRNSHWIVALAGVVSLAYAAGMISGRSPVALSVSQARDTEVAHAPAEAQALSSGFRHASRVALPAMVSIDVRGKVQQVNGREVDPEDLFQGSPFGDLFKNDPRLKDFFRRGGPRQMPRTHGMGSGFVIDPSGIILTANHVVADADRVTVKLADGSEYDATDIKTDPLTDVAIVRIKPEGNLHAIALGDSDRIEIGDWVLAIGSPFGLDATVTAGIISAKGRGPGITKREDFLQTDAAINPGNSGGPLINLDGEVVGINTAISTRSGGYDGVGFAVPINLAKWVTDQLIERGHVTRAYIGVVIQPLDNDLARNFGVPLGKGAIVTKVIPDSPAAEAKLEQGDVVLKFDGKDVHGTRDLQSIVERVKVGSSYPMEIVRNDKRMTLSIKVKEMPKEFAASSPRETLVPGRSEQESPRSEEFDELGISVESAKPEALKQLGYGGDEKGVLVTAVKEDSPAAQKGIREGMVIESVGSKKVSSPSEFRDALKGLSVEKGIRVFVATPRGGQFLVIHK